MNDPPMATLKLPIKDILKKEIKYKPLFDIIKSVNELITIGYLFMRSYILYVIDTNKTAKEKIDEPIINLDFIKLSFSVILVDENSKKKGRPFDKNKQKMYDQLKKYFKMWQKNTGYDIINISKISYILGQSYQQIHTAIINNIQYHFDKYVWTYIKTIFNSNIILVI